jgi:hypothetical protein
MGIAMPDRIAMINITIKSSTRVKPSSSSASFTPLLLSADAALRGPATLTLDRKRKGLYARRMGRVMTRPI